MQDWSGLKKLMYLQGIGVINGGTDLIVSGTPPLSLPNSLGKPLKAWSVDLVPKQNLNGHDAPWPAGGGKNKYNTAETAWSEGTYILDDNGNPTMSVASHYTTNYTKVVPSTGYTLSGTIVYGTTLTGRIYFYDSDKHWISRTSAMQFDDADGVQFTTPGTCEYIQIQTASETTADWMLEIGSTPSAWSPYSNICPIYGTYKVNIMTVGDDDNQYNKDTVVPSVYLDVNGVSQSSQAWTVSEYIKVCGGATYTISGYYIAGIAPHCCWYDSNKTFIGSFHLVDPLGASGTTTITAPANASFIRMSIQPQHTGTTKLEIGSVRTDYTPYVAPSQTVIDVPPLGKNLYNMAEQITSGDNTFLLIDVAPNTDYTFSVNVTQTGLYAQYDNNGMWVSLKTVYNNTVLTFNSGEHAHIRLMTYSSSQNLPTQFQFELGSSATSYEPYNAVYNGTVSNDGGESRWGEVDLGTLMWVASANRFNTYTALPNAKLGNHADCMCETYRPDVGSATRTADLAVSIANGGYVYIYDTTFTGDATAFQAAMNGIKFIYALQTPTEFTITAPTIPTTKGDATAWATAEDGTVDSMEVTYVGKA